MRFFDSNVLVYAATNQDERKRTIAVELIGHALTVNHDGAISTQILSEFTNVMLKKSLAPVSQVEEWFTYFYRLIATDVTPEIIRSAVAVKQEYGIQFFDAVMVATAEKLGCHEIITEDLNDGQTYRGMVALNPFRLS